MKNKDWVIIITTPFKNEENDIKNTIEHMINQKIKPTYWIMVDDYSDDNSYKIASQFTEKNPWIKVIKSPFKKNLITTFCIFIINIFLH